MSETPEAPESAESAESAETSPASEILESAPEAEAEAAPAPVKRRVRRGRVALVAGSVVLALAVAGGVGWTVVTVQGADRDAGPPVWRFPKATDDDEKAVEAVEAKGLRGMLLPFGSSGYGRGPDMDEFGSDAELSGGQATALRKQALADLPRSQRLRLEKEIDKQHITGMVMRSYLSTENAANSSIYAAQAFTVDVTLSQMDKGAARDLATYQNEFLDAMAIFRKGPEIKDHKNARCFLPPTDADEKLDAMYCSAYEGNVMITTRAFGIKPMDTKAIALFLKEQLDRITEPGEAV
ncbi:hypothetical protein [Streptomyces sp. NPDC002156]